MREKFIVRKKFFGEQEEVILGLRYNAKQKELLIGGTFTFVDRMREVFEEFGVDASKLEAQRHSTCYRTKMLAKGVDAERWKKGMEKLEAIGWRKRSVRSFRRLMG